MLFLVGEGDKLGFDAWTVTGTCALDLPASQVLVVGDTFSKDILPARQLGCYTLWIKGLQWEKKEYDESVPDGILTKLSDMEAYLL